MNDTPTTTLNNFYYEQNMSLMQVPAFAGINSSRDAKNTSCTYRLRFF